MFSNNSDNVNLIKMYIILLTVNKKYRINIIIRDNNESLFKADRIYARRLEIVSVFVWISYFKYHSQ